MLTKPSAKFPQVFASGASDTLRMTPEFARFLTSAEELAKKSGDDYVTAERLLLATAMAQGTQGAKVLNYAGVTAENLNRAINEMRGGRKADSASAESGYDARQEIHARSHASRAQG